MQSNSTDDPWATLIAAYLEWLEGGLVADGTMKLRRYQLERFAAAVGVAPADVQLDHVTAYFAGHRWSASTVRSYRAGIRGFYKWGVLLGHLEHDPTALMRPVKAPTRVRPPASEASVAEGLASADARVRLMVRLGAEVGLRAMEIAAVHAGDVLDDFVGYSLVVHGKGSKERLVPIEPDLAHAIRACAGYLFPGRVDGHLSAKWVSKLLSRSMTHATGHQLRHRFGTVSYESSRDLRAVQELLGHASSATTEIYVHVDSAAKRRAASAAVLTRGRAVVALAS